jgi:hypothetical protein
MFKWPMLAAAASAIAFQPAEVEARPEIETVVAIPAQTAFATHFRADQFVT